MVKHKKLLEEKLKQQDTSLNNFMKDRGSSDLELQIKLLQKEIDTLKTIIDIKDIEIDSLKEDIENKKWQDEIANNTPNSSQFDKVWDMKFTLVVIMCSAMQSFCLPPVNIEQIYDDAYSCYTDGYQMSYNMILEKVNE